MTCNVASGRIFSVNLLTWNFWDDQSVEPTFFNTYLYANFEWNYSYFYLLIYINAFHLYYIEYFFYIFFYWYWPLESKPLIENRNVYLYKLWSRHRGVKKHISSEEQLVFSFPILLSFPLSRQLSLKRHLHISIKTSIGKSLYLIALINCWDIETFQS